MIVIIIEFNQRDNLSILNILIVSDGAIKYKKEYLRPVVFLFYSEKLYQNSFAALLGVFRPEIIKK